MLITETFSKVLLKFYMLFCVCMYCADLMVWIDPLIAVSRPVAIVDILTYRTIYGYERDHFWCRDILRLIIFL